MKRYFWPVAGAALIVFGISANHGHQWWLASIGFVLLLFWFAARSNARKSANLLAAPSGSVRVETVKQQWVNQTVKRYAEAGWTVDGQSSAKSLGSQARVTLTFRKP